MAPSDGDLYNNSPSVWDMTVSSTLNVSQIVVTHIVKQDGGNRACEPLYHPYSINIWWENF